MPPDWREAYYTHYMNAKVYSWPLTFHKVMQQEIWWEVSFNSSFLRRSFLNLTVKKLWKLVH